MTMQYPLNDLRFRKWGNREAIYVYVSKMSKWVNYKFVC